MAIWYKDSREILFGNTSLKVSESYKFVDEDLFSIIHNGKELLIDGEDLERLLINYFWANYSD